MQTNIRPYSLPQASPSQLKTSYDVVQRMQSELSKKNELKSQHGDALQAINEESIEYDKHIVSLKNEIFELQSRAADKRAIKKESQFQKLASLQEQIENYNTKQSSSIKFQESIRSIKENIHELEQRIEVLKNQNVDRSKARRTKQSREETSAANLRLHELQNNISSLQSSISNSKITIARQENMNDLMTNRLSALQETFKSTEFKKSYCLEQKEIYSRKVCQKKAQLDETMADYEAIHRKSNNLINSKKIFLEQIAVEVKDFADYLISSLTEGFERQLQEDERVLDDSFSSICKINLNALKTLVKKRKSYYEQLKENRENELNKEREILADYWRYVNEEIFQIYNKTHREYLYAADFKPYDSERRRVFTWRRKYQVLQGDWKLKQTGETFSIYNDHHDEYLYADPSETYTDSRRQVFTWRPKGLVKEGSWKLIPIGNNKYRILNVHLNEYLYAAEFDPFDNDRRRVFTWILGDPVTQGEWTIKKFKS